MVIFYKSYRYSPKATIVSALGSVGALLLVICGIALIASAEGNFGMIAAGIALAALAVFVFIYVSRKLPDKIAAKDGPKNIRTKAGYALQYVREHPDQYDAIRAANPAFAEKYTRNADGKIVKNK